MVRCFLHDIAMLQVISVIPGFIFGVRGFDLRMVRKAMPSRLYIEIFQRPERVGSDDVSRALPRTEVYARKLENQHVQGGCL